MHPTEDQALKLYLYSDLELNCDLLVPRSMQKVNLYERYFDLTVLQGHKFISMYVHIECTGMLIRGL